MDDVGQVIPEVLVKLESTHTERDQFQGGSAESRYVHDLDDMYVVIVEDRG